jgi:hypothetical protein
MSQRVDHRRRICGTLVMLVVLSTAGVVLCAQTPGATSTPPGPLEFDAASVKPSNPNSTNGTVISVTPGGRLHVVNATLQDLIETAYDVRSFQIDGGP